MAVTVASTTDTEEDVKIAAGLPAEGDEPQEEALSEEGETSEEAESEPAKSEDRKSKSAAASEAAEEEEEEEPKESKSSSKFQKRLDKLTEEKYELRDQNRELRERLDRLEATSKKEPQQEETVQDQKPLRNQFKTDDEYFESLGRWSARDEARKNEATVEQQRLNEELAVTYANYNEGVLAFKEENPDYNTVVGDTKLVIPMAVQTAIISYEQEGPALAYFLAKNPGVATRLREMSSTRAVAEIGKIHSKLFPDVEEEAEVETLKPPAKKPVSKAPAPIKPNRASATNSTVNLEDLPYADYRRVRDSQERGRIRR